MQSGLTDLLKNTKSSENCDLNSLQWRRDAPGVCSWHPHIMVRGGYKCRGAKDSKLSIRGGQWYSVGVKTLLSYSLKNVKEIHYSKYKL